MKKIIFATNNRHKLEEVEAMLSGQYTLSTPKDNGIFEDIPENEPTIEGNAAQKATYIFEKLGANCFADDTGLEVEALGGAPGVYSARYAGEPSNSENNIDLLLKNLENCENRAARFKTVISLILDGKTHSFEGIVEGKILKERQGEGGFGYDSVFMPTGYDISFAQMSGSEKNEISHRGRAVRKLVEFLKENSK